MHITAFYRTFDGDNTKPRPSYYSKRLAFESFLRSWRRVPSRRLVVAVASPSVPPSLAPLIESDADEVLFLEQRGNSASYRAVLAASERLEDDGLVYHAEDDYLYHPDAFPELIAAAERLQGIDYFTLYDHLDRYTRRDDARWGWRERIVLGGQRHWRVCESTCMTFAARTRTLRRDAYLHRFLAGKRFPHDRLMWRIMQGIGAFWWKVPKRRLVSPMPSLATHLDPEFLAPVVDWAAIAADVGRASGLEPVIGVEHLGG